MDHQERDGSAVLSLRGHEKRSGSTERWALDACGWVSQVDPPTVSGPIPWAQCGEKLRSVQSLSCL